MANTHTHDGVLANKSCCDHRRVQRSRYESETAANIDQKRMYEQEKEQEQRRGKETKSKHTPVIIQQRWAYGAGWMRHDDWTIVSAFFGEHGQGTHMVQVEVGDEDGGDGVVV